MPRPKRTDDVFAPVRALLSFVTIKEEWVSDFLWKKMDHRQQYLFVFDKARSFYVKNVHQMLMRRLNDDWDKLSGLDKQKAGRQAWTALQKELKEEVFHMWAQSSAAPEYVREFIRVLCDPERHAPNRSAALR